MYKRKPVPMVEAANAGTTTAATKNRPRTGPSRRTGERAEARAKGEGVVGKRSPIWTVAEPDGVGEA